MEIRVDRTALRSATASGGKTLMSHLALVLKIQRKTGARDRSESDLHFLCVSDAIADCSEYGGRRQPFWPRPHDVSKVHAMLTLLNPEGLRRNLLYTHSDEQFPYQTIKAFGQIPGHSAKSLE